MKKKDSEILKFEIYRKTDDNNDNWGDFVAHITDEEYKIDNNYGLVVYYADGNIGILNDDRAKEFENNEMDKSKY